MCAKADAQVAMTAAKAWVSEPKSCLKGKRFTFLAFTLRDLRSDSGVKHVNLFTKHSTSAWFARYPCAAPPARRVHAERAISACLLSCSYHLVRRHS